MLRSEHQKRLDAVQKEGGIGGSYAAFASFRHEGPRSVRGGVPGQISTTINSKSVRGLGGNNNSNNNGLKSISNNSENPEESDTIPELTKMSSVGGQRASGIFSRLLGNNQK